MENIDSLVNEVKQGDLIKLYLDGENRTFVGYVWYTLIEDFLKEQNARVHWAKNPVIDNASTIYLSSLNPDALEPGNDGFRTAVQFVGIDVNVVRKATIQGIRIKGYEVLEKSNNLYLLDF